MFFHVRIKESELRYYHVLLFNFFKRQHIKINFVFNILFGLVFDVKKLEFKIELITFNLTK